MSDSTFRKNSTENDNYDDFPELELPNSDILKIDAHEENMDDKIAYTLFTDNKRIRNSLKSRSQVRITGFDGRYIIVKEAIGHHSPEMTSLKRATAAASYYLLEKRHGFDKLDTFIENQDYIFFDKRPIKNYLAEAHQIPKETNLYYIYTTGLDYLVPMLPIMATALIAWRRQHSEQIFNNPNHKRQNEFMSSIVYFEETMRAKNFENMGQLFTHLSNEARKLGVTQYLAGINPKSKN